MKNRDAKKGLLAAGVAAAMALSACQSTPDDNIVISKDQDEMLAKIGESDKQTAGNPFSGIPGTWEQAEFGSDITIKIDAGIVLPEVSSIPVRVVTADTIDQDMADRLLAYFTGGKPLYNESFGLAKSDYEEQILRLKANINDPDADWRQATKHSSEEYESALAQKEKELENLKSLRSQAPETIEPALAETKFHEAQTPDQPGLDGSIVMPKAYEISGVLQEENGNIASIYIYNSVNSSGVTYTNLPETNHVIQPSINTFAPPIEYIEDADNIGIDIDIDSAVNMGSEILNSLEIEGMALFEVGVGKIFSPNETFAEHKHCYTLIYTRNYKGILQTYDGEAINYTDIYANVMPYEKIIICINDDGLIQFEWVAPVKVVETVGENVTLMDFNNIMDIFEKQIQIQVVVGRDLPSAFYEADKKTINIDRIALTMERIKKQDSQDAYLIVPAWNFYGTEVTNYNKIKDAEKIEDLVIECKIFSHSYLTINAIDGSIIDRTKGY